jgi:raffinose/stachyose/melibiose transport system substrate-binding protein
MKEEHVNQSMPRHWAAARLVALVATLAIAAAACGAGTSSGSAVSGATAGTPSGSAASGATAGTPSGIAASGATAGTAGGGELAGDIVLLTKWPEPDRKPYFDKVVAAYQAAHPNVHIDLQAVGDQPYKDKIRVLSSANQLPDIYFSWAGDFAKKFVRANLATDLTGQLSGTEWGKSFSPAAVTTFTYDGKIYGVPIDLDAKFFAYNKKLFADNGVKPPTTLDELLATCDALKTKGIQAVAFGNQFGWPAIHYITTLNARYVPLATRNTDYDPATGAFTDPGYVQALSTFKNIADHCFATGTNGVSHEAAQAQMLQGKAATQYIESFEFSLLTEKGGAPAEFANNWDFFQFPTVTGAAGEQASLTGAPDGFMVNANSKHVEVAIDFLKFFTNPANAQQITKENGWLSPVQGSATAANTFPQNIEALDAMTKASGFDVWLDTVTHIEVANAYLAGVQGLLDGSKTPDQIMKDVQAAAAKAKASL